MHPHTGLRLTRTIYKLVIWIIAISIVNTEEKLNFDESIVNKGINEGEISNRLGLSGISSVAEKIIIERCNT